MPCDRWPEERTKEVTWYPEINIVWECSTNLGDPASLPGINTVWEGWVGLVR